MSYVFRITRLFTVALWVALAVGIALLGSGCAMKMAAAPQSAGITNTHEAGRTHLLRDLPTYVAR